ncbi:hypothetical protein AB0950_00005, partial [Streptomyces sp. NPDC007189]
MKQLQKLVVRYGECQQKPVRFRPETWRWRLTSHGAAHVLDIGVRTAHGPSGDRLISRGDLARLREHVGDEPDALRDLFVAVMIWGSGTTIDLECVMSSWWLASETGAGEAAVEDVVAVLK